MKRKSGAGSVFRLLIRLVSLGLLMAAGWLASREWQGFTQASLRLPPSSLVAGVPVGNLEYQAAVERLQSAYSIPVELQYGEARLLLDPAAVQFQLDLDSMLPRQLFASTPGDLAAFRAYLWREARPAYQAPLQATYSAEALDNFLAQEIAARYDRPARLAAADPASGVFYQGTPGQELDREAAHALIRDALFSLQRPVVSLPLRQTDTTTAAWEDLQALLEHTIRAKGFDGVAGVYLLDMETGQEIHFGVKGGARLPVEPDIAFTASSIIKIPILTAAFQRLEAAPDELAVGWFTQMIARSSNDAADQVMRYLIDEVRGPLVVSEDMQAIGLENTFLAGYFSVGSPLLNIYQTPANGRADVNTDPDPYNQTTPSDVGRLLGAIYHCAKNQPSQLGEAFGDDLTPAECEQIIAYLKKDRLPYMLTAGLPEGTQIAHKHGYAAFQGVIHTIGDAGLIFTPGGDYVMVVFLNDPELLLWDPTNELIATLSRTAYNYYNPLPAP